MRRSARRSGSLPRACTPSTSHRAGLPCSAWAMPSRSLMTPVSLLAAMVHTSPAVGTWACNQARSCRPSGPTGMTRIGSARPSTPHQCFSASGTALCSVAPTRSCICGAGRPACARRCTRADSTAVWMPSVAPLVKTMRPLSTPSTRCAAARAASRMARAFRPAMWVLLGLPKSACIAASAAARACGSTGVVALASRLISMPPLSERPCAHGLRACCPIAVLGEIDS